MWYYESNGQPAGPVSEIQMGALKQQGQITPDTRIWKEGWPDWKNAGEVLATPQTVAASSPEAGGGICAERGKLVGERVLVAGHQVCLQCKPKALDKVREGLLVGSGPWREGKVLVMRKDSELPHNCIKCGEPASKLLKRTLQYHHPAIYIVVLINVILYVIIAMIVRNTSKVLLPFCSACEAKRKKQNLIAWALFILSILMFVGAAFASDSSGSVLTPILGIGGAIVLLGDLIFIAVTPVVQAKLINKTHAWITKVKEPFLAKLPPWPGA